MGAMKLKKKQVLDSELRRTNQERQEFAAVLEHFGLFVAEDKYKVLCPFHADKLPSMQIDMERVNFFCYGCGKTGGAFKLVRYFYPNKSDMDILKIIQRIKSGANVDTSQITFTERKRNLPANKDYYYNLSRVNWFTISNSNYVKHYLKERGYTCKTLNQAECRINENLDYPIIFPIKDNGVFRGYVCRTTRREVEEKRKYLYNTGFRRRTTLAGTYTADTVMLVEGFMDKLKANQFGVVQVSAILGWKITEKQIKKLKHRGVKTIISALDHDEAGRKGTNYLRSLKEFNVVRLKYPMHIKDFGDLSEADYASKIKAQLMEYPVLFDNKV